MKKSTSFFLILGIVFAALCLVGCQQSENYANEIPLSRTVIDLNENNYWEYINVSNKNNGVGAGEKDSIVYAITGVLDYALYEDVVFSFDVVYYTDGQSEKEYQRYTMRIGCNAAGDAEFETYSLGITNVSVGKLLGIDGELVNLENYNRKIELKSVTGKIIYTQ